MAFTLPDLPYDYDALSPHMSSDTLHYHHDKHHQKYLDTLNEMLSDSPHSDLELEEIIQKTAEKDKERGLFNNAAQHWNHSFFWPCMTPNGGGKPDGEIARRIDADLGGYDDFKKSFLAAATGQFGSGWAWLVLDAGKLKVTATPNAEPPFIHGQQPVLACDVWEHAYYLDYQNARPKFVETFLDHLVNWDFVNHCLSLQGEGSYTAARSYQEAQARFASSGDVEGKARDAKAAIEGDEAAELEHARQQTAKGH